MRHVPAWILLAALLGCDEPSPVAGGTTTDTDNALAFQVLDTAGRPLAGAVATLWPAHWVADTGANQEARPFFALRLDSEGRGAWRTLPEGRWQLEVVARGCGARVQVDMFEGSRMALGKVVAPRTGGLVGRLGGSSPGWRGWVRLRGSSRIAPTDSAGGFRFDSLPAGSWILEAVVPGSGKQPTAILASVEPGERTSGVRIQVPAAPVAASADSLVAWDFEGQGSAGTSYTCSGLSSWCGLWTPTLDTVRTGAWSGASAMLPPESSRTFGLADSGKNVDLTSLDSLGLMVRGPGRLRVTFHSLLVQDGEGSLCARVNLAPGWQRLIVRELDITPDPGSRSDSLGRTWAQVRDNISHISFESRPWSGNPAETLLVDDIVLHGKGMRGLVGR